MYNEQTETYANMHSHTHARLCIQAHEALPKADYPLLRFVLDTKPHTVIGLSRNSNPEYTILSLNPRWR